MSTKTDSIIKKQILKKIIDPIFDKKLNINIENIKQFLTHQLTDAEMDTLIYLICDENYEPLKLDDIVTFKPAPWI